VEGGVKALSLTQPWATAIALGLKKWETRSWPTGYRGEIAIHASKGFPRWAKDFAVERGFDLATIPLGRIVCVCDLTECRQAATLAPSLSQEEIEWGDYSPERFAFKFENVRVVKEPRLATGKLGIWSVGWDDANNVIRQLRGAA
jgi:hypothetical protein